MPSWTPDPAWTFPPELLAFWTERHLCALTTVRADGRPHQVPVGVALDVEERCAWVITGAGSHKVRHLDAVARAGGAGSDGAPVAAGAVDGARWSTLEGRAVVRRDEASVARACERYASRYRTPRPNPDRVAIRIDVDRFLASASLLEP